MAIRLVSNLAQARNNHAVYQQEMAHPGREEAQPLVDVIPYIQSWIATRDRSTGALLFAPSKFIGYAEMNAVRYSRFMKAMDGRLTERVLEPWMRLIAEGDDGHEEARDALFEFCAKFGKTPNGRCRISLLDDPEAAGETVSPGAGHAALARLLVEVFRTLPQAQQREVARQIAHR